MANRYDSRSVLSPKRTNVDLSCEHLTTLDFFRLQPIYVAEQINGNDTFNVSINTFLESSPFAQRVYGSCHLDLHAFFVPYSILWDDWNNFFFGNRNNQTTQSYTLPFASLRSLLDSLHSNPSYSDEQKRIFSSLGYPLFTNVDNAAFNNLKLSVLPLLAYQRIWWDYYRDSQNLTDSDKSYYLPNHGGLFSKTELSTILTPRYRTFKKDPFSTLISNPQLGSSASASVLSKSNNLNTSGSNELIQLDQDGNVVEVIARDGTSQISRSVNATALRGAIALQRYLERLGITGGTRPLERLIAEFGVESPRIKYQMCDFIGSKRVPVSISGLQNTSTSSVNNPETSQPFANSNQVNMGNRISTADALSQSQVFSHTAKEQGLFIVMASLIPEFNYYHNLDPLFTRGVDDIGEGNLDFYRPDFQDIGYEEVLLRELRLPLSNDSSDVKTSYDPFQVVGYRPKYESYRYKINSVSGDFLQDYSADTLFRSVFTRDVFNHVNPDELMAGLLLTTSDYLDRINFDKYFQVMNYPSDNATPRSYDHFVCRFAIQNNAVRPITGATMPEELTHVLNAGKHDVAFGGVRL